MAKRAPEVSTHRRWPLASGWQMARSEPGACLDPDDLERTALDWSPCDVPGTVASALRQQGVWSPDGPDLDLDNADWWFRTSFAPPDASDGRVVLGFDGLATLADVWLNGRPLLSSDNMFVEHEERIDDRLAPDNGLVVRCHALAPALAARRPRPRWRTPMLPNQQLRWFRTTLLGRTPGWSPPAPPIGPWRGIWCEVRRSIAVGPVHVRPVVQDQRGIVHLSLAIASMGSPIDRVTAIVSGPSGEWAEDLLSDPGTAGYSGAVAVASPALWWPHTHGTPTLYSLAVHVSTADARTVVVDLGSIGFRTLSLDREAGNCALSVNGVPMFCRGACWMPLDAISLGASDDDYRVAIGQAAAAGMNMLRVSGTTVYEADAFYDTCDEQGLLVWQDCMFASMDYPGDHAPFCASVEREVSGQLARLHHHPSIAVLSGNSEVSQQAAMSGAPRALWTPALFTETIARLANQFCPNVPYCSSSAEGGAFPHQPSAGSTSYYGVGAYRRPVSDARTSAVRFASECLAFANLPDEAALLAWGLWPGMGSSWKGRTPRDLGAAWDFEDVRDHYVNLLFGVVADDLRRRDPERYVALARVATGEVMAATIGEWRRAMSACHGALVWTLRDLVPGAGWGVVDADGRPKAAYHYLKRACQPQTLVLTDEGVNGLAVHVANDRPEPFEGRVEVHLYRDGEIRTGCGGSPIVVAAHATREFAAAEWFAEWHDLTYAYQFGQPPVDLVVANLIDGRGARVAESFYFPLGLPNRIEGDIGLTAEIAQEDELSATLAVSSRRFAQSVVIEGDRWESDAQYFHLAPGSRRELRLTRTGGSRLPLQVSARALNSEAPARAAGRA